MPESKSGALTAWPRPKKSMVSALQIGLNLLQQRRDVKSSDTPRFPSTSWYHSPVVNKGKASRTRACHPGWRERFEPPQTVVDLGVHASYHCLADIPRLHEFACATIPSM